MTDKQLSIYSTACKLFANEGFSAVTTKRIAKESKASEALLFKSFKSKEGLIQEIKLEVESFLFEIIQPISDVFDPSIVITKTLLLPFQLAEDKADHIRLHFFFEKDYWDTYANSFDSLEASLQAAFKVLHYPHPDLEARFLLCYLEGAFRQQFDRTKEENQLFKSFIIKKYGALASGNLQSE